MIKESINTVGQTAQQFLQFKPKQVNLLMFICNHCPYVRYRMPAITQLVREYKDVVNIVAINSNDSTPGIEDRYIEDAPEYMPLFKQKHGLECDYIYDKDQTIAKAYSIECTPEFIIVDRKGLIAYHGEFDPSRKTNELIPSGSTLKHALDLVLIDQPITWKQQPSFGCSIKWSLY